jgi:Protein of unknown function (DUF2723)
MSNQPFAFNSKNSKRSSFWHAHERVSNIFNFGTLFSPILSVFSLSLVTRLLTLPGYIESRDGFFFVKGVERYSLSETRPFWPGYPVYIWFGSFFNLFYANPVQALHVLSVVASTLTLLPLAALTSGLGKSLGFTPFQAHFAGFAAAIFWALMPLSWLTGSEIYSDPLALLFAITMLWLCQKTMQTGVNADLYFAALFAGLMLGVRLAYLILILPLLYVTWLETIQKHGLEQMFRKIKRQCFGVARKAGSASNRDTTVQK